MYNNSAIFHIFYGNLQTYLHHISYLDFFCETEKRKKYE